MSTLMQENLTGIITPTNPVKEAIDLLLAIANDPRQAAEIRISAAQAILDYSKL